MRELVRQALGLDKRAIARLISLFEDRRLEAAGDREAVLAELAGAPRRARFIGITGTPGAGKSTLVGELATRLVGGDEHTTVAVLAVDPSSQVSGGALLGDRTRVRFPAGEPRLFFRSQASDRELGGVSRTTFPVCRLLHRLFDVVFVETVGIGQSETEIQHVADWTYLVLQPLAGDQIQFMKAGIMEIPDAIILNKCDQREAAERTYHALYGSLRMLRPSTEPPRVHRTSGLSGEGLDEVVAEIRGLGPPSRAMADKERVFFSRWVRDEFGRTGLALLERRAGGAAAYLAASGSYERAQRRFAAEVPGWLAG
jgi:LAO/AO transport system kinase